MCLAIYRSDTGDVPKQFMQEGFRRNPDGAGFAFPQDGEVVIRKGYKTFKKFYKRYLEVAEDIPMLIHFRYATKGNVDQSNCHPFRLSKKFAMIHNGTIDRVLTENEMSDSWNFANRILGPIVRKHPNFIYTDHGKRIINLAIGGTNKVAVMNHRGKATIFNEKLGHWRDGTWYSNFSYDPYKDAKGNDRPIQGRKWLPKSERGAGFLNHRTASKSTYGGTIKSSEVDKWLYDQGELDLPNHGI